MRDEQVARAEERYNERLVLQAAAEEARRRDDLLNQAYVEAAQTVMRERYGLDDAVMRDEQTGGLHFVPYQVLPTGRITYRSVPTYVGTFDTTMSPTWGNALAPWTFTDAPVVEPLLEDDYNI